MQLTPIEFLTALMNGKTEKDLNFLEDDKIYYDQAEIKKLIKYGHTLESASQHLATDYSNGYTICKECGSFYQLDKGFTKHLSNGCLNCEGESKHKVYHVNASLPSEGGFPARWMSQMFDDGMSYCKDKLEKEKFKEEVAGFKK